MIRVPGNACVKIVSWCIFFLLFFFLPEKCNLACSLTLAQLWGFGRRVPSLVCEKAKLGVSEPFTVRAGQVEGAARKRE